MEAGNGKVEARHREPAGGILVLVLLAATISGLLIHNATLELGWEKLPRFVSIMVGAPLVGLLAGLLHRYIKMLLAVYVVAALIFIVGLLVWINIKGRDSAGSASCFEIKTSLESLRRFSRVLP